MCWKLLILKVQWPQQMHQPHYLFFIIQLVDFICHFTCQSPLSKKKAGMIFGCVMGLLNQNIRCVASSFLIIFSVSCPQGIKLNPCCVSLLKVTSNLLTKIFPCPSKARYILWFVSFFLFTRGGIWLCSHINSGNIKVVPYILEEKEKNPFYSYPFFP